MTLPDLLYVATILICFAADVPAAWILTRNALVKPRITALSLLAFVADAILLIVIVTLVSIANANAGYPLTREFGQITFRTALLILALFPPLFLLARRKGWFRDGVQ